MSIEIESKIKGFALLEIFSQNKDELILGFASSNTSLYIKAHLQSDFCCLYFSEEFHRSKRNSVNLFKEAIGCKVIRIRQYLNERCFSIDFDNEMQLVFKMHGNRSNIILLQSQNVVSLFKNSLNNDINLDINQLDRSLNQSFEAFRNAAYDYKKLFPTFGKPIQLYLERTSYYQLSEDEQWHLIQELLLQLKKSVFYVEKVNEVYSLTLLNSKNAVFNSKSAIDTINYFYLNYIKSSQLSKEKKQAIRHLEKKYRQSENYISKVSKKLESIANNTNYEIKANVIMANLHNIEKHANETVLTNFYDNTDITIKLNPKLSPQKNAENFYRKSKNQKIEIQKLKETLKSKEQSVQLISSQLKVISTIKTTSELRKYLKENNINFNTQVEKQGNLPYHDLTIDGYIVWIGKNAKNNDVITQKLAWKEDLWLHAKDVSGSHVIIKHKAGHVFPKHVIEKAAQWAAFYSKRKNESLCPVIVTPKKFVRKPKGLPAGAVVVDKESVVLVTPEKPSIQ